LGDGRRGRGTLRCYASSACGRTSLASADFRLASASLVNLNPLCISTLKHALYRKNTVGYLKRSGSFVGYFLCSVFLSYDIDNHNLHDTHSVYRTRGHLSLLQRKRSVVTKINIYILSIFLKVRFVNTEKFTFEVDNLRKRRRKCAAMMTCGDVMSLAYRRHEYPRLE